MQFSNYIALLGSLFAEAFTIWGLFATVSLGFIAFIGSVKRLTIPFGLTLCFVFFLFAGSNFLALNKNFESRAVAAETAKQIWAEEYENNKALVDRFAMTYCETDIRDNLRLHGALAGIVVVILLAFTASRSRNAEK